MNTEPQTIAANPSVGSIRSLEEKLNKQKSRIGLVGGRLRLKEVVDAKEPLKAAITPTDWHLEIAIKEGYEPVRDEQTKKYVDLRKLSSPLETICSDLLFHECGHWELPRGSGRGCPYDETYHDQIKEAIHKVLATQGKQGMASYVANAFEDVLVNTNARNHTKHYGQILFWNEQGMTYSTYTKFYDAFVQVNLALWGDKEDMRFLRRWSTKKREVRSAVKNILSNWNVKGQRDISTLTAQLYNKQSWPQLASAFATAVLPLLDEQQKNELFGASASPDGEPQEGSAFDQKLASKEGQEKASYNRYANNQGQATNRESFEQLDSVYRRLARDIPVEIETFTQGYTFPIVAWGKEPFDQDRHNLLTKKVSIGIGDDGNAALMVNKDWIQTEAAYKRNITRFPNLRVALIDTSISMTEAPDGSRNIGSTTFIPWGDNSKYHYALLGYYGIESFLQRQHIAPYVDKGVVNFGSTMQAATGTGTKKLLLTPQWSNSTRLDPNILKQNVNANTFLISLSDGDIQNWHEIRDAYRQVIMNCSYAHIHIGSDNTFTQDLKSWGIPVHLVQNGKDVTRLMVKAASDRYRTYGRQTR